MASQHRDAATLRLVPVRYSPFPTFFSFFIRSGSLRTAAFCRCSSMSGCAGWPAYTALPDGTLLVIPQRAVRDLQGQSQVAVVGADDKVEFKNVKLGPSTGSDYVVAEGLKAGERVVVEGLQKIRNGMAVKPVAAQAPTAEAEKPIAPEAAK